MKTTTVFRGTLALVLLSVLASCATSTQSSPASSTGATSASPTAVTTTSPDGAIFTYTDTITYSNPSGTDQVQFSVTTDKGVITSLVVTPEATNKKSIVEQGKFKDAATAEIVGKPISGLNVSAVGGASLTTGAFNEFIQAAAAKEATK